MNGFDENQQQKHDSNLQKNSSITQSADNSSDGIAQKARVDYEKRRGYLFGIATSGLFVALMIISAFISIPIGPIAFTLQFLVTNICCLLLGKKWGTISVFLYVLLGILGLPIFAAGGGGFAYVLKPSFGFLIGFGIGGFFAALVREKVGKTNFLTYFIASLIDMAIMDVIGVAYGAGIMYGYMHATTGIWEFLMMMLIPFIPIDIVKCVIGSFICPKINKFVKLK